MHVRLCIILLFFCYALMQASEQKEIENETIFDFQIRARKTREQSKKFYAENKLLQQAAIQRKIERVQEEQEVKVAVAEVYEIPLAVPIDDSGNCINYFYENNDN